MQTEILYQPSFAVCVVTMDTGEQLRVEGGAMVGSTNVSVQTQATGGFMKSLKRSLLGGESFFQNTYTSEASGSQLLLAPALPGDIMVQELNQQDLIVQSGSYIAASMAIEVSTDWGGAKTFFGGEGLFMLRCTGSGTLITSSYGAIHKTTLSAGQEFTVDTGHIVAFDSHLHYEVRKFGGWKTTILGGEGLVVVFTGPGDIYLQTRSQEAFLGWLIPHLPRSNDSN
ncbi:TIGR00266 family protein [soil metagenome]